MKDLRVVEIIDNQTVVINAGYADGITKSDLFTIYREAEEIIDPITNENLGRLHIVKGTAQVENIQENMTTIKSNRINRVKKVYSPPQYSSLMAPPKIWRQTTPETTTEYKEESAPFQRDVEKGDIVTITNRN